MNVDLKLIAPEIFLSIMAMVILVMATFLGKSERKWLAHFTLVVLVATGVLLARVPLSASDVAFSDMFLRDGLATVFKMLFLLVGVLTVLVSHDFLKTRNLFSGEFFALLLFSLVGMMLIASAFDFMMLFVGLELTSLATYIMVGLKRRDLWSNEAAIKYFLLSVFASAILLFGVSIVYAATGTTNFAQISSKIAAISAQAPGAIMVALILLMAGLGFKITAVPFHMYAPDVYQGAPTPITIFLAVGPKAAAFAGLLRVVASFSQTGPLNWVHLLTLLSVLTMTIGNTAAVLQSNVKRMLAYSSVAHAGYVLIGVAAMLKGGVTATGAPSSVASVVFYLLAYTIMNVGAFGFLMCMKREGEYCEELADFAGLGRHRPALAGAMFILLLALAGIPPTIGFFGKFYIFLSAIRAGLYWLAVMGVINVVISLFYYARVVVYMFMRNREREVADVSSLPLNVALIVSVAATIVLGLFPQGILAVIEQSASGILKGGFIQ